MHARRRASKAPHLALARGLPLAFAALAACAPEPRAEPVTPASAAPPARHVDAPPIAAACLVARDAFEDARLAAAILRIALDDRDVRAREVLTSWVKGHAEAWATALRATVDGDAQLRQEAQLEAETLDHIGGATRSAQLIDLHAKLDGSLARVHHLCRDEPLFPGKPGIVARLAAPVIQIVVRSHFAEMRACYDLGLAKAPQLAGEIRTKFVIAEDGATTSLSDDASKFPDGDVIACVQNAFAQLRFPPPTGGRVTVIYPVLFNPSN